MAINPDSIILALFPKLQLLVIKEYGTEPDGWPIPLRSCVVDVYQPVSQHLFATIQEYPLWWPEHETGCDFQIERLHSSGTASSCCSRDKFEWFGDDSPRSESSCGLECFILEREDKQEDQKPEDARCTCVRVCVEYIGEICFLPKGHIIPASRPHAFLQQLHPDIRIFASWNRNVGRIAGTLRSLFLLFEFMNHPDIDPRRNGCNVIIRAPSIALVPIAKMVSRHTSCDRISSPCRYRRYSPETQTFTLCYNSSINHPFATLNS
jgi:hypothetical protein